MKDVDYVTYGSPAYAGDTIEMTIDLRPFKNKVSFSKNGVSYGPAFSGLNYWGDVYIMFSFY